jgi:hypothetical protein
MKRIVVCLAVLLVSSLAWAGSKTYQATGPVVDVRDDAIVVDKGKANGRSGVTRTPK